MELLIANVSNVIFKIDRDLSEQYGALPLPFQGMDKSTAAVCQFYNGVHGMDCDKGASCPFRHIRGDRTIVCKHWLRGLCKKGDQCEFLHEFDMTKMPECYFYSRFHACHNKECPFLHIDPESKIKDCPWYDRGFCRHGPHCRHRHVRRVLCTNYLAGFCPDGSSCKYMHPRFELPPPPEIPKDQLMKRAPTCHFCGEVGHKASFCQKIPPDMREAHQRKEDMKQQMNSGIRPGEDFGAMGPGGFMMPGVGPPPRLPPKPIEEITCFKCGTKGHYANKCPKGHLAFLSHSSNNASQNIININNAGPPPPIGGGGGGGHGNGGGMGGGMGGPGGRRYH